MRLLKADHQRRIEIHGVAEEVLRPVDIDRAKTGFTNLRSLRIYRFDQGSEINGHAEEDEVFVIVLAGSVDITVTGDNSGEASRSFALEAVDNDAGGACMVYLPPLSAYQLVAKRDADVAYARATPRSGPASKAFAASERSDAGGVRVLLEEDTYAERLRVRVLRVTGDEDGESFLPLREEEASQEALIHLRLTGETSASISTAKDGTFALESWDSVAVEPSDRPRLHIPKRSEALVVVIVAS